MAKKIYFVGGRFQDDEQRDIFWNKYGLMLKQVYNDEAKRDPRLRDFRFVPVYKCDHEEFERMWTDPNTYGIFWFSHGSPEGYPVAHHYKLDDEPWERLTAREWEASLLKPENLEKSSRNLRFVVLMGCRLGRLEEKWQQKMPASAQLYASGDDVWMGKGTAQTAFDDWIMHNLLLSKPKTPTEGARFLFQYLTGSLELAGGTTRHPFSWELIRQRRPLESAILGVQKKGLSTPQVNVRPFPTPPPQAGTVSLIQQRQQMEAQRRRMQEDAQRRAQQRFETQQRHTQEQMKAQQRRAQEEAERRRALQDAQRRAQEEAQRRRAQEEAERRRAQEEAQRRAGEEAQRRQLALDLARIRKPFVPTVRPHIWEPPRKTRIFTGGPPYIGGVPMGGDPRPDWIEKIRTRW